MTAVEWLLDRLEVNKMIPNPYPGEYWNILKRGALEMEKEQKESAYLAGEAKDKQYYNETFKSE